MKARLLRWCDRAAVATAVVLLRWIRHLRTRQSRGEIRTVVAIKLVGMGDAVLMLPALAALRGQGRRLTVVTSTRCAPVFCAPGIADAVVVGGQGGWMHSLHVIRAALRTADVVLDFEQHVFWSTLVALLAGRGARLLGFRTPSRRRNRAYDALVSPAEPGAVRHMKEIFDDLARAAGAHPVPHLLPLPVGIEARVAAENWMRQHQLAPARFVVIAPGTGPTVPFRRLPPAVWVEVAAGLPAELAVVLVGGEGDRALLQQLAAASPRPLLCAAGLSLAALAHLLHSAACVLAIDSGPMHLAAAMGAPVLGIFGPDTPARYAPYSPAGRSLWQALPCSPCNNCWAYQTTRCNNPERHACTRTITAAQVLAAASLAQVQQSGKV